MYLYKQISGILMVGFYYLSLARFNSHFWINEYNGILFTINIQGAHTYSETLIILLHTQHLDLRAFYWNPIS